MQIDPALPYELLVMESALAAYHHELDTEAFDLESLAGPSLERLAVKVLAPFPLWVFFGVPSNQAIMI